MDFLVAKVGGSLFDLPDLGSRLQHWIAGRTNDRLLLVSGGGRLVDEIRRLNAIHGLGEERSHWLALRAMSINAEFMAGFIRDAPIVGTEQELHTAFAKTRVAILNALAFCRMDENDARHLPHSWAVTSDSVAMRVAVAWKAIGCGLLKSAPPPGPPETWAAAGYTDAGLFQIMAGFEIGLWAENLAANSP